MEDFNPREKNTFTISFVVFKLRQRFSLLPDWPGRSMKVTLISNAANFSSLLKSVGRFREKLMQQSLGLSHNDSNMKSSAQIPTIQNTEFIWKRHERNRYKIAINQPALILSVIFPQRDLSMNIFSTSPEFLETMNDIRVELLNRICKRVN